MSMRILMLIAAAGTIAMTGCRNTDNERDDYYDSSYTSRTTTQSRSGATRSTADQNALSVTDQTRETTDARVRRSDTVWHSSNDPDYRRDRTLDRNGMQTERRTDRVGDPQIRTADQEFVKEANIGNLKEVELGRLAQRQASNDRVRQFAQKLIDDHSKANDELATLARTKSISLASQLPADHKQMVDKFNQMRGEEFDREFVQHMIRGHEKMIQEFDRQARTGEDAQIKAFAQRQLPILRSHLQQARDLQITLEGADVGLPGREPTFDPNNPDRRPVDPTLPRPPSEPVNPADPYNPLPGNPATPR